MSDKITLQMASLKQREGALQICIRSLINQVDLIRITLNRYESIPDWLVHEKIEAVIGDNSLMDGHKYNKGETNEGFVLVCDDDIEYPSDFVSKMKSYCEMLPHSIVSIMGKNLLPRPMESYALGGHEFFRTFEYHSQIYPVNLIGMCGTMYHSNYCKFGLNDIKVMNGDVNMSVYAKNNYIKGYVIPHYADWCRDLSFMMPSDYENVWTYNKSAENDKIITDFINQNL